MCAKSSGQIELASTDWHLLSLRTMKMATQIHRVRILAPYAVFLACALTTPMAAHAGFSFKKLTGKISRGVGKHVFGPGINAATAPTIANAENAGMRLIREMDKVIEKNIKTASAEIANKISESLDSLDKIATEHENRIDDIFTKHEQHIDQLIHGQIEAVDRMLEERIDQVDDMLERQIGNVDVITTKAVNSLETGAERAILQAENGTTRVIRHVYVLIILTFSFIAIVCISVITYSTTGEAKGDRKKKLIRAIGLAVTILVLAAGAIFFYSLVNAPSGAIVIAEKSSTAEKFISEHEEGFRRSMASLDLAQARIHAYRLAFMNPNKYRDELIKTELIRDILERPTALFQISSRFDIISRFSKLDEGQSDLVDDRNMMVAAAYILWRLGDSRAHEHLAARLCAKALKPEGSFPLEALAYNYLYNYLKHPLGFLDKSKVVEYEVADVFPTYLDSLLRGSPEEKEELVSILESAVAPREGDEFSDAHTYNRHRILLQEKLVSNYFDILNALYPAAYSNDTPLPPRLEICAQHAKDALNAWEAFRADLGNEKPVFRLAALDVNIAILSRIRHVYKPGDSACRLPLSPVVVSADSLQKARVSEMVDFLRDVVPAFSLSFRVRREIELSHQRQELHLIRIEEWFEERATLKNKNIDQGPFIKLESAVRSAKNLGLLESVSKTFEEGDLTHSRRMDLERLSKGHDLDRDYIHLL